MATLQEKIAALIAETREGTVTPERLGGLLQELYEMAEKISAASLPMAREFSDDFNNDFAR